MSGRRYSEEARAAAIEHALDVGVDVAAKAIGCNPASIYLWFKAAGLQLRTSRRFDREALICRAAEIGVNAAAREAGVHACQISRWRHLAGLPPIGRSSAKGRSVHPASFVRATVRLARRVGPTEAASRQKVAASTVRRWLSGAVR